MDKDDSYKALNLVSNGNTTVIQLHQQMTKVCSSSSSSRQLQLCTHYIQGIVYLPGTETRQFFCRVFVTLKKIKELFHPT